MARHYCEAVVNKKQKLQVCHAPTDPDWDQAPEIQYGMLAYLGYPLCWSGGVMFGTLCVLDNKENPFGQRFDKVLTGFREVIEAHLALIESHEMLEKALNEVKVLRGMLPICCVCKKIRDDQGYWNQIESYIGDHSEAEFTHSLCPECMKSHYGEFKRKH